MLFKIHFEKSKRIIIQSLHVMSIMIIIMHELIESGNCMNPASIVTHKNEPHHPPYCLYEANYIGGIKW